jgi:hypothetical protein
MHSNQWREEALRRFPQFAESFAKADTPYMVWIELNAAFETAYTEGNEALIRAIYDYAGWCCRQPAGETSEDDLGTCVACCLFEHIPIVPKALHDMPRWWKLDDVVVMKEIFSYHAGPQVYAQILARFGSEDARGIQRIEWAEETRGSTAASADEGPITS